MSKDPYSKIMSLIAGAMDELDAEQPSRERALVQTKLDEAMMWAERGRRSATAPINLSAQYEPK